MKEPTIDICDNTYTRNRTTDINKRREFGRLEGHTSNTVGKHYLRLTMSEPRTRTEWQWEQIALTAGADKANTTRVGIRLHAGQVKQLRNFLNKWLQCHYEEGGAK